MKILVVDNYDSFTYILVQYLGELGASPEVVKNDELTVTELIDRDPDAFLISPGPGRPENAGVSIDLIAAASGLKPILGVCLGHQAIVEAFGGKTISARRLMHGKTCNVLHNGKDLFDGIPSPTECMRYHSLIADPTDFPDDLEITAWTTEDKTEIMALRHRRHRTWGVQFHPESIGSKDGKEMVGNFLRMVGGEGRVQSARCKVQGNRGTIRGHR